MKLYLWKNLLMSTRYYNYILSVYQENTIGITKNVCMNRARATYIP